VEVTKVLQYWISQLKAKNEAKEEFYSFIKNIGLANQRPKKGSQRRLLCFPNNLSQGLTKQN